MNLKLNANKLKAIDVHVHLEPQASGTEAGEAAKKYFGDSGAARDAKSLADYYRSRNMACVVFTVDERLSGVPRVSNDEVVQFAADNPDVAIAFASIDPTRGETRIDISIGRC